MRSMPWRDLVSSSSSGTKIDNKPITSQDLATAVNDDHISSWNPYTSAQVLVPTLLLTAALLGASRVYKRHLRQIPTVAHIKPDELRNRTLYGYVTSVGDGDDFRFYHTPGGRLAGWGWLYRRRAHILRAISPLQSSSSIATSSSKSQDSRTSSVVANTAHGTITKPKRIRDATLHIRIAGVDAPELAHFGRPAQPYGEDALVFLKSLILGRNVTAKLWRRDQYGRVVATVHVRARWTGLWRRRDVGLEMIRAGAATVYEAKFGSEFGGQEAVYAEAEKRAKAANVGMWAHKNARGSGLFSWLSGDKAQHSLETPRQYKDRMKTLESSETRKT